MVGPLPVDVLKKVLLTVAIRSSQAGIQPRGRSVFCKSAGGCIRQCPWADWPTIVATPGRPSE